MSGTGHRAAAVIDLAGLDLLISGLHGRGYEVIGPTVRGSAIVYEPLRGIRDLPRGIGDEQAPGRYRLRAREDEARFGYAVPPTSWKRELHPPRETLWSEQRTASGEVRFTAAAPVPQRRAFLGVRACEIAAIAVQDGVFMGKHEHDPRYAARRAGLFIVAVQCGDPAGTCFCVSMATGPRAADGFDLALTELVQGGDPEYVVEVGSDAGAEVLEGLPSRPAAEERLAAAAAVTERATARMGRSMDTSGLRELLLRNADNPRWDDVADRCLSCGNCTMACPTCFCSDSVDLQSVDGDSVDHVQEWASCFSLDFSHTHGGTMRSAPRARYRQWMTHKLATWWDQFDSSGCVGCGRCIAWCPVGIDITEEAAAIRASDGVLPGARADL